MNNRDSIRLSVELSRDLTDLIIAELADLGFDIFEIDGESEEGFGLLKMSEASSTASHAAPISQSNTASITPSNTAIDNARRTAVVNAFSTVPAWRVHEARVLSTLARYGLQDSWSVVTLPPQNWNETWEATIQPIRVPPYYVRPSWAEPPDDDLIDIVVDPKMSFGTGYHESTRLVLSALPRLVRPGCKVLDAGSGTGILAIAALKLGAGHATAFDIDEWCAINAAENFENNGCVDSVSWTTRTLDDIRVDQYDLILANINRKVLIDILPSIPVRMARSGKLVLAGLLVSDRDLMVSEAFASGLTVASESSEGEWWSVVLEEKS